jgi:hypothetical protein
MRGLYPRHDKARRQEISHVDSCIRMHAWTTVSAGVTLFPHCGERIFLRNNFKRMKMGSVVWKSAMLRFVSQMRGDDTDRGIGQLGLLDSIYKGSRAKDITIAHKGGQECVAAP